MTEKKKTMTENQITALADALISECKKGGGNA